MSRKVGINKSSFYHHFADIEVFIEHLLEYHLERAKIVAAKERECKTMIPDLLNVLVEYKEDLLFSRQLRINSDNILFKECYEKSNQIVGNSILEIWAETLGLKENSSLANLVLKLSLDNFYLQITEETLTYEWLENFVNEFIQMVEGFKNNQKKTAFLNGSV
jgi:AcrR family transcriptional regulator